LDIHASGAEIFVKHYGQLISANRKGQLAMEAVLHEYLKRIERTRKGELLRFYPVFDGTEGEKTIVIDPRVQFGRPCLAGTGIPTAVILDRFLGREDLGSIAEDFGRSQTEIQEAIRYETSVRTARAA
jgi:uncharacterized protein (DUF433 family)